MLMRVGTTSRLSQKLRNSCIGIEAHTTTACMSEGVESRLMVVYHHIWTTTACMSERYQSGAMHTKTMFKYKPAVPGERERAPPYSGGRKCLEIHCRMLLRMLRRGKDMPPRARYLRLPGIFLKEPLQFQAVLLEETDDSVAGHWPP